VLVLVETNRAFARGNVDWGNFGGELAGGLGSGEPLL
jgi:hypothetical protein